MGGVRRVLVVAALSLVGFAWALVVMGQAAVRDCVLEAGGSGAYDAQLEGEPRLTTTVYRLRLTQAGSPVTGVRLCVSAELAGRTATEVRGEAVEVAPGLYEVFLAFEEPGRWDGQALVVEIDGDVATAPLSFEVKP